MRVLICGAGVAGLTLAWCLERRGHVPIVVERAPHLRDDGYMIDFFGSGFSVAQRLGLLPALESIHYPVDRRAGTCAFPCRIRRSGNDCSTIATSTS